MRLVRGAEIRNWHVREHIARESLFYFQSVAFLHRGELGDTGKIAGVVEGVIVLVGEGFSEVGGNGDVLGAGPGADKWRALSSLNPADGTFPYSFVEDLYQGPTPIPST